MLICGRHQLLTQRQSLARPFSPRQPISGHPGRVRNRAAKEDDLVPGQGAFRTRDELVDSNFSTAQAESLTKLFPSGSTLAKFFEAQELREAIRVKELKEEKKVRVEELKEEKKVQEEKEKARARELKKINEEINERIDKQSLALDNLSLALDNLSLALGISVLVLLVQNQGTVGALSALFKSLFRL